MQADPYTSRLILSRLTTKIQKKKKSPTLFYLISLVSMMKHRKNTNKIDILNRSSWKLFLEGKYEGGETRDLASGVYHTVILGITEYFEHPRFNLCI